MVQSAKNHQLNKSKQCDGYLCANSCSISSNCNHLVVVLTTVLKAWYWPPQTPNPDSFDSKGTVLTTWYFLMFHQSEVKLKFLSRNGFCTTTLFFGVFQTLECLFFPRVRFLVEQFNIPTNHFFLIRKCPYCSFTICSRWWVVDQTLWSSILHLQESEEKTWSAIYVPMGWC